MNDQMAYILNSLWTRHHELGRIVRFRHVVRGHQAVCYEVLTAEQREFLAYLYPAAFETAQLAQACEALAVMDRQRFSVVPMLAGREGQWAVGGPQGTQMLVGLSATGQCLLPDEWTLHDISQLGLRVAWMHRLLAEHVAVGSEEGRMSADDALETALARPSPAAVTRMPKLNPRHLQQLQSLLADLPAATGWCHGDLQPAAVLMDDDHQLRTLVDWGLLHVGDPLEDMVDVFVHWCVGADGVVNGELGRVLIEAYRTLRELGHRPWEQAVTRWCAQRVIDMAADRRGLPRGFANYLGDPNGLAGAMELCEAK